MMARCRNLVPLSARITQPMIPAPPAHSAALMRLSTMKTAIMQALSWPSCSRKISAGKPRQTLLIYALITLAAVLIELLISVKLSGSIKASLLGYEPDVFSAMYQMRENILESLDEGIIAIDKTGTVQFANQAAATMLDGLGQDVSGELAGRPLEQISSGALLLHTLESGEKEFNSNLGGANILIDRIPIKEEDTIIGAIGILHNRAEYTKLMEDLTRHTLPGRFHARQ